MRRNVLALLLRPHFVATGAVQALVQGYAPRPVVDFISRMHAAPAAAADAARSAGHSAAEVVSGSTGSTFDDLHAQAQVRPHCRSRIPSQCLHMASPRRGCRCRMAMYAACPRLVPSARARLRDWTFPADFLF